MARSTSTSGPESTTKDNAAVTDTKFVGWVPGCDNPPRKSAPRLHHKKSRTGCQQCRARRVKCNEVHPVCASCERHQTACVWGRKETASRSDTGKEKVYDIRPKLAPSQPTSPQDGLEVPECKERRMLELRLLHQFTSDTAYTLNVNSSSPFSEMTSIIPHLAFKHNSLLYSMYTVAALHVSKLEPNNSENMATYQRYLGLTLKHHRNDVANLGPSNADAACLTSSYLRVISFALMQERPANPYSPPIEWLQMCSTTGEALTEAAWKYIADDPNSIMRYLVKSSPVMRPSGWLRDDNVLFQENNRRGHLHLLRRTATDIMEEPWNETIQAAYEDTISQIGSIQIAISAGEPTEIMFKRLALFPTLIGKNFIQLVIERRPRALVVLAHYFALLKDFSDIWWIGDTGIREVRGIQSVLSEDWLDLMIWPLQSIEDAFVQA